MCVHTSQLYRKLGSSVRWKNCMFDMQMEVPWNWFPSLMTHFSGVPPTHTLLSLRTEKIPLRAQAFGVMFGGRTEPTAHACQLSSELYSHTK